jgi:hypothetical protein
MRSNSVEIKVNNALVPAELFDTLDIEYSSKEGYYILWFHPDDYKPLDKTSFTQVASAIQSAYNRVTQTNHLDIYIEDTVIDQYGLNVNGTKYKNICCTELGSINLNDIVFARGL